MATAVVYIMEDGAAHVAHTGGNALVHLLEEGAHIVATIPYDVWFASVLAAL